MRSARRKAQGARGAPEYALDPGIPQGGAPEACAPTYNDADGDDDSGADIDADSGADIAANSGSDSDADNDTDSSADNDAETDDDADADIDTDSCWLSGMGENTPSHMNLGWCNSNGYIGSIVHEIDHLIGLSHEQIMQCENIDNAWKPQYTGEASRYTGSANDGAGDVFSGYAPYDFESIMHYSNPSANAQGGASSSQEENPQRQPGGNCPGDGSGDGGKRANGASPSQEGNPDGHDPNGPSPPNDDDDGPDEPNLADGETDEGVHYDIRQNCMPKQGETNAKFAGEVFPSVSVHKSPCVGEHQGRLEPNGLEPKTWRNAAGALQGAAQPTTVPYKTWHLDEGRWRSRRSPCACEHQGACAGEHPLGGPRPPGYRPPADRGADTDTGSEYD